MKILHRIGTSALTFPLLLTGLFIFTAWKAVDESLIFSDDPLKDQKIWQSNSTIPIGHEDMETEAYLQSKKIDSSDDSDGARFLEDDQPVLGLQFFARTLSPSSSALLQYSCIRPYILDMRTVPMSQADHDFQKESGNPMLFGDHQNSEDDRRGEIGMRELHPGDLTPPSWLSASYTNGASSLKVDMTNGVMDHPGQSKRSYPDGQKHGSGFDTIPPPKQTDVLIIDLGQAGKADPGDRIRYEVTIENVGSGDANGVQLNIVPDPLTTFVPGSFRSSPLAVNDSYTSTGNIGINVSAANGLKANDFDDNLAGATISAGTFGTTGGGSIMINADGSFVYTPAAGFTGSDTYTYTLNDGNGVGGGVPAVDMATVTITVSNLIWFIDNGSVAATEDGRLNTPFKTIANFSAAALPTVGQVIFIKHTGNEYRGGFILKNNQLLLGSGHTGGSNLASVGVLPFMVATHSFTLPTINSARPLIRNMGTGGSGNSIGIVLASGNTIRGVEIGRCELLKISGTNFGTLTIGNSTNPDVALSGNQNVLDLRNGVFAATSKVASINSPDSSGLLLNVVSGSLASGNTLIGAMGSGSFGIDIDSSSASLDFGPTTVSNFNSGPAISITSSGTGSLTFGSLTITGSGAGLFANTGGTINIGGTSSTIAGRPALDITNTSFGSGATFATITSTSSGGKGVNLDNVSGPVVINGGSITSSAGIAFDVNAGSSNITYAGTINNANRAAEVTGRTGGTVTFSGNITNTGTGINVASNTGGTIAFSGSSKSLNTGGNTAVTLATNSGATINFTNGGLAITTTTGTGFNATGGATAVTVQGTGNTINSTSGTALNVTSTTIGASGLTFQSISKNGGTNGIALNNTGSVGGLTVTGTGSAGSGGTIQNCTSAGISLALTSGTNLSWMIIQSGGDDGIYGSTVNGISLANCTINNNGNDTGDEGIEFINLLGISSISNCTVTNNAKNNFKLYNTSGTLTSLTVSGSTFEGHNNPTGNHGFLFEASETALVSAVNITNSIFRNNFSLGMQVIGGGDATISSFIVSGCTFSDTGTGNSQEVAADFAISHTAEMTYQFLNNTLTGHNSHAFNTFTGVGAGTTGKMYGLIQGNTIGVQATIDSGSKIGNGIRININGDSDARIRINNNTIHQIPAGRGIECIVRNGNGNASFIVTNNTITAPTGTAGTGCGPGVLCPLAPIHVQSNCVTVCNTGCAVVTGNTAYDPTTVPGGLGFESSVQLHETGASTLNYEGNTALSALQNLINANPNCVTKSVTGAVAVVASGSCPTQ